MQNKKVFALQKSTLLSLFVFALCAPIFLVYGSRSVDIDNYGEAYEKGWYQFEPAYNFFMWVFKSAGLSFSVFWVFIGLLISTLFSRIYARTDLILLALPNIIYLLSGSYSTQLRYSLASLIFVYLFGRGSNILIFISSLFHLSMMIPLLLKVSIDKYFRCSSSILYIGNFVFFITLVVGVLASYYLSNVLLNFLGYSHYIGSKFLVQKSIISMAYIIVSYVLVLCLLVYPNQGCSRRYVCLSFGVLTCCICYSGYAMVSGRLLMFYFLLEPFVMLYAFRTICKNFFGWIFLFSMALFQLSKFGSMV